MKTKQFNASWLYLLLIVPTVSAVLALNHFGFFFKSGTAGAGIIILLILYFSKLPKAKDILFLMSAFLFSIVGDWFLSNKQDDAFMFVYGIVFFFFAHVGYLLYAWLNGHINKIFTLFLLFGFFVFFMWVLFPSMDNPVLTMAVLVYLVISCISLGTAVGIRASGAEKWAYIFGIFLILFSDTIISLKEFVGYKELNFLILPTYYLAHISVTFSVMRRKAKELN
ncbi:lysoplasmalogenase [Maribellus maritimus]|uniref:lysoplasmalogenase n=1 Tax=Maribellus maritimus TaxID=2870838 RepID=UPI001EEB6466|nr:lysoplasmalogenase [Maribellus maritimus]MCG6186932.1 lysoplasmalogenase [Maribellus maritimus]